jgi:hypothetical protein
LILTSRRSGEAAKGGKRGDQSLVPPLSINTRRECSTPVEPDVND